MVRIVDLTGAPIGVDKKKRKSPVHLTLAERWAVAKYCIENRNILHINGELIVRVNYVTTAKEVTAQNVCPGKGEISASVIKECVEVYFEICRITEKMPFQSPTESVEADKLKIENEQLRADKAKLNKDIQIQGENFAARETEIVKLLELLDTIHQATGPSAAKYSKARVMRKP